jgi:hypothetical protein
VGTRRSGVNRVVASALSRERHGIGSIRPRPRFGDGVRAETCRRKAPRIARAVRLHGPTAKAISAALELRTLLFERAHGQGGGDRGVRGSSRRVREGRQLPRVFVGSAPKRAKRRETQGPLVSTPCPRGRGERVARAQARLRVPVRPQAARVGRRSESFGKQAGSRRGAGARDASVGWQKSAGRIAIGLRRQAARQAARTLDLAYDEPSPPP